MARTEDLMDLYERLEVYFGDLRWWPAESLYEVIVGAILTQNTAWTNVEKAIARLRALDLLSACAMDQIPVEELADVIRPSGYYHLKANRLKAFTCFFLSQFSGEVERMAAEPLASLRKRLLALWGIGPETADSILLYACNKPSFVSDAYTKRILVRHGFISEEADYDTIRSLFMGHLTPDVFLFKQFHALLVHTGKEFCRKAPRCTGCPLLGWTPRTPPAGGKRGQMP